MKCVYCQANNGSDSRPMMMSAETAEKSVDIALQSPEKNLNFEFQGGEPLLNYPVIRHIVEYAETRKGDHVISYNIVTNLSLLDDEKKNFFRKYHFGISTSVDGDCNVHNHNRTFQNGDGTFEAVAGKIRELKKDGFHVGAIETTTRYSLQYPGEIVRTYFELGFDSIFIRPLTPLGRAAKCWDSIGYTPEEFVAFYRRCLDEIINLNMNGHSFREEHAAIFLRKIDGQFMNYMELRSPCGAGIGQMAYYSDGSIFTCDEGRMLYEMGNDMFRLGHVGESCYQDLIHNRICRSVSASSILESIPSCCDCVYQPYCGTCPVVNYALDADIIAKQPRNYRCRIYSGMLDEIFRRIYENEENTMNIFKNWSK